MAGTAPNGTGATWHITYTAQRVTWTLRGDAGLVVLTADLVDAPGPLVVADERGRLLAADSLILHYGRPANTEPAVDCPALQPCFMHTRADNQGWRLLTKWARSGHHDVTMRADMEGIYRTLVAAEMKPRHRLPIATPAVDAHWASNADMCGWPA